MFKLKQYSYFGIFICCFILIIVLYKTTSLKSINKYSQQPNLPTTKYSRVFAAKIVGNKNVAIEPENNITNTSQRTILTEKELKQLYMNDCDANPDNILILLNCCKDTYLPLIEYKRQLADNFTKTYSNPSTKMKTDGKLTSYKGRIAPNPTERVPNRDENIDMVALKNTVTERKKARLLQGDEDFMKIPELIEELKTTKYKIPNIIHIIWFGKNRRFCVYYYMTIIAALRYQKPKLILFHYDALPVGEYWEAAKKIAGKVLRTVKRTPPTTIFGHKINAVEHQADVVRLELLIEAGGIYLDTDGIILKSVDPLRNYEMILGEGDYAVLANGVILANKDSWFLHRWYHEYKIYQDNKWGFNSVLVPWALSQYFPDTIYVAHEQICRPSWSETHLMYRTVIDWEPIYITHLFNRVMRGDDGIAERPLKQLAVLNTTYGEVARHVIWGDKKIMNVTEWIVTCNLTKSLSMGTSLQLN